MVDIQANPTELKQYDVSNINEFPPNDLTELYFYIEEDIDGGVGELTGDKRVANKISIADVVKSIEERFKKRFLNTDFFHNVLDVDRKLFDIAELVQGQHDDRIFYQKLDMKKYKKTATFSNVFGIANKNRYDKLRFALKELYEISDNYQDVLINMAHIGSYARESLLTNENKITSLPVKRWFTLERDSFNDVIFNVPLIHCLVRTDREGKVIFLDRSHDMGEF